MNPQYMEIKTIGIIGCGAFGVFLHTLARRFLSTIEVKIYSSRELPDGKHFSLLRKFAAAMYLFLP
jgi:hypothetical protein